MRSPTPYSPETGETAIPTCREMAEKVTDYLEGAMSFASRAQVRLHLFQCKACVNYFNQIRRTIGFLADAPPPPPPAEGVADRVIEQVRRGNRLQPGDD